MTWKCKGIHFSPVDSAVGRPLAQAGTLHHGLPIKHPSYRAAYPDFTPRMTSINTSMVSMFSQLKVTNSLSEAFNCLFLASYHLRHAYPLNKEPKARQAGLD